MVSNTDFYYLKNYNLLYNIFLKILTLDSNNNDIFILKNLNLKI